MIETVQLGGTDKQLYQLVAPLVMNPEVLKQNYNFPFRTKESFVWFIALENEEVLGFIPVENRKYNAVINNYYIKNKDGHVLELLLNEIVKTIGNIKELVAVSFLEDRETFLGVNFKEEKQWTRYIRMIRNASNNE